jgi:hypothetical protein
MKLMKKGKSGKKACQKVKAMGEVSATISAGGFGQEPRSFVPTTASNLSYCLSSKQTKQKQTPWSESASELYRPSDRRLSAK